MHLDKGKVVAVTRIHSKSAAEIKQVKPSRLDGDLPKDGNAKCIGLIQALD